MPMCPQCQSDHIINHGSAAGKPKKLALTACAHKLLRILNAMARTGKAWDPKLNGLAA